MPRIHLFEWEDQPWFPAVIRDAGTAYLEFAARIAQQGKVLAPRVADALARSGHHQIVDLCSGGAGPLPAILMELEATGHPPVEVHLTDLYPNHAAFGRAQAENPAIQSSSEPVNATAVPKHLTGVRTLFSGLHHFRPKDAQAILAAAVADRAPIAIFEVVARHPAAIVAILFAPLMTLLALPFLRPFRWGWIPLTYLIPVIPLFIGWDGLVSCLRCYKASELRAMTDAIAASDYEWEVGDLEMPGAPFPGTYLIGIPSAPGTAEIPG